MLDYREHAKPHLDKFKGIKLLVLDNDGILTSGGLEYLDLETPIGINYSVIDGLGMAMIKHTPIKLAIISGRESPALTRRLNVLKIDTDNVFTGVSDKGKFLRQLMETYNLKPSEVAYMGDDLIDLEALEIAGLSITVPNCHPMVVDYTNYQTLNKGGDGAVREVTDLLFIANDYDDLELTRRLKIYWNAKNYYSSQW